MVSRTLFIKVILFVVSLVTTLFVSEVAVRILRLAPDIGLIEINSPYASFVASDDLILKYVPKPMAGDVNSYGIRDLDRPIEKLAGTYRIVVIGDSIGFGYCSLNHAVSIGQRFSNLLEAQLNTQHFPGVDKVEVFNLSVSGYNSAQEVRFLELKGLNLNPDLVIVAYCLNDDEPEASLELRKLKANHAWNVSLHMAQGVLLRHSHLARLVYQRLAILQNEEVDPTSHRKRTKNITQEAFERLKELSVERGFVVLNVVFPNLWRQDSSKRYLDLHEEKIVSKRARGLGFLNLDLLAAFEEASGGDLLKFKGTCEEMHPNEAGHAAAADAIGRYLIDSGIITNGR